MVFLSMFLQKGKSPVPDLHEEKKKNFTTATSPPSPLPKGGRSEHTVLLDAGTMVDGKKKKGGKKGGN